MHKTIPFLLVIAVVVAALFLDVKAERDLLIGVLSVATFLFSAITVSAINDRQKRMVAVRDQNSIVRAMLLQVYFLSSTWGRAFQDKTLDYIDAYLRSVFNYRIEDQAMTNPAFAELYEHILGVDVDDSKKASVLGSLNLSFNNFVKARQDIAALLQDNLPRVELFLSVFLGMIIIVGMLVINTGTLISMTVTIGLSVIVIFLIVLVLRLERMDYSYEDRILEPYQQTFEELGLLRYYPEELLSARALKRLPKDQPYRVGKLNRPYPDMTGLKIGIANDENSNA